MSRSRALTLSLLFALVTLPLFAEKNNRCGTKLPTPEEEATFESAIEQNRGRVAPTVVIPVWVHVISSGAGFENGEVPLKMIKDQINVLNDTFAGLRGGAP